MNKIIIVGPFRIRIILLVFPLIDQFCLSRIQKCHRHNNKVQGQFPTFLFQHFTVRELI